MALLNCMLHQSNYVSDLRFPVVRKNALSFEIEALVMKKKNHRIDDSFKATMRRLKSNGSFPYDLFNWIAYIVAVPTACILNVS